MHSIHFEFADQLEAYSSIRRLDARVKIVCTFTALLGILTLAHWQTATLVFASCLVLAFYGRASMKRYLRRMLYPLYIIAFVSVLQPFTYGSTIVATTPLFPLPIYSEGLWLGLLIFARCLAAVAILNLLICVSPVLEIIGALEWFHVPSALLDVALLMFRYIFVVFEEAERIYNAQQSRCGYSKALGFFGRLRNYGTLFGILFMRSYDRAVTIGNAMIARGYTGEKRMFTFSERPISAKDILYGLSLILAFASLILADWLIIP
jgi:cobalt/nickel transport system permease protein